MRIRTRSTHVICVSLRMLQARAAAAWQRRNAVRTPAIPHTAHIPATTPCAGLPLDYDLHSDDKTSSTTTTVTTTTSVRCCSRAWHVRVYCYFCTMQCMNLGGAHFSTHPTCYTSLPWLPQRIWREMHQPHPRRVFHSSFYLHHNC